MCYNEIELRMENVHHLSDLRKDHYQKLEQFLKPKELWIKLGLHFGCVIQDLQTCETKRTSTGKKLIIKMLDNDANFSL